ncbi:MoaD/ThiS family protein [Leptospira licerasiae]|uniref:ThiS family protein n=1 Tax=Leptospira licerasiae str. MMD4847 TaxID=1049971 RepID=A0ABP2REM9_9LEPT|nr:MoaD/ThiS family protein [Leptospira licerasiae]EIE00145.1 ThiS family protein [Leptospira licerasiae serovar Varillal str. VAR 010]EJZ41792.1 ThiS family protein [Leptospira licerasiae str. MMD4847]
MDIQLLFFAAVKDHFPDLKKIEVSEGHSILHLREILTHKNPDSVSILKVSRFAVDQSIVGDDYILREGSVVAVLPPSSGG